VLAIAGRFLMRYALDGYVRQIEMFAAWFALVITVVIVLIWYAELKGEVFDDDDDFTGGL